MQTAQQTSPAAALMIFKVSQVPEWSPEYLHFSELCDLEEHNDLKRMFELAEAELSRIDKFKQQQEHQLTHELLKVPPKKDLSAKKQLEANRAVQNVFEQFSKLKAFALLNQQAIEYLLFRLSSSDGPWRQQLQEKNTAALVEQFQQKLRQSNLANLQVIDNALLTLQKRVSKSHNHRCDVVTPTRVDQDIIESSHQYVLWLERVMPCALVQSDVAHKFQMMAADVFQFFRATFYRWMQLWPVACPGLAGAPQVLAVGDVHFQNFGTWRDAEGRWCWGLNDFDEAFPMAYTTDLVRCATSLLFAAQAMKSVKNSADALLDKLLQGYTEIFATKCGNPIILAENHPVLFQLALNSARDHIKFWRRMTSCQQQNGNNELQPADQQKQLLIKSLPKDAVPECFFHRVAGLGSLGRQRFVCLAKWHGSYIARECKPAVPPASYFAAKYPGPYESRQVDIMRRAVRCPDPCFRYENGWLVRRLSPECGRIELSGLRADEELELVYWMGAEIANVHLGVPVMTDSIIRDFNTRPKGWLSAAASQMKDIVQREFETWRKHYQQSAEAKAAGPLTSKL